MGKYNKGIETKNNILRVSRELFYLQGYNDTTARQIAENSNTNLGLIKYYFESKGNIARYIYKDIRESIDTLLIELGYVKDTPKFYLISIIAELILAIENEEFCRFYIEVTNVVEVREHIRTKIIASIKQFLRKELTEDRYMLNCVSISAIKPAVVRAVKESNGAISKQAAIEFYIQHYITVFGEELALKDEVMSEINTLYIGIVKNFTPIITKLS